MTDKYTADDFKQSRFANHPQRGVAARARPGKMWAWIGGATEERFRDDEMVSGGWSPVHECPNPSRHESPDLMDGGVTAAIIEQEGIRPVDPEGDAAYWRARAEKAEEFAALWKEAARRSERGRKEWRWTARLLGAQLQEVERDLAYAREYATDQERDISRLMTDRDAWKANHAHADGRWESAEREVTALREQLAAQEPAAIEKVRPLTADDVAMQERAMDKAEDLGFVMDRLQARNILTAALTVPQRPEGADAIEQLIESGMEAQSWRDNYAALADYMAERGVRVGGAA